MTSTIYLAGPMRGITAYNFPSFAEARTRLREAGWTVICPAEQDEAAGFDPTGLTGHEDRDGLDFTTPATLERCILDVMRADAVALLPGWARSEGARAETLVALLTGRTVYAYMKHRPTPLVPFEGLRILTRADAA